MPDYHNNPAYQQASSRTYANGYANNPSSAEVRRPAATAQRLSQPQSQSSYNNNNYETASAATSSSSAKKRVKDDPVDWERYFGGKPPKEIIVIDDDEPSPSYPPQNRSGAALPQQPAPAAVANGAPHHADKRRKTQTTATNYDPVYQPQTSYSNTQTPYSYDDSPGHYATSTNRTNSYNTTAPTSLASNASNGAYLEEGTVGQKRKRTTRQGAADQKRREVEARSDPYAEYVPPPRPPIKAKDVYVNVVPDVRPRKTLLKRQTLTCIQRTATRDQKVDDDDGHYIVVENSDITERCTYRLSTKHTCSIADTTQTPSSNFLAKVPSARSYKPGTENDNPMSPSRSSAQFKSTATLPASSYASCQPSHPMTNTTETNAFICETLSTSGITSASSPIYLARASLTF